MKDDFRSRHNIRIELLIFKKKFFSVAARVAVEGKRKQINKTKNLFNIIFYFFQNWKVWIIAEMVLYT